MFTPDESNAIIVAFKWGYLSRDDINDLAIAKIEQSDGTPPANICELAMCKQDFEMHEVLNKMAEGAEKWASLKCLFKTHVQIEALTNIEVSELATHVAHYIDWDDAKPWRDLKILDHEIGDARVGAYGDFDELCLEYKKIILTVVNGK